MIIPKQAVNLLTYWFYYNLKPLSITTMFRTSQITNNLIYRFCTLH